MAGFDFWVHTPTRRRVLTRNLLFFIQRLGAERGCFIRFRWETTNRYYVTADGKLPDLQSLGQIMLDNLVSFAEGHSGPPGPSERARLAERVGMAYLERLIEFSEDLQGLVDSFGKERIHAVPNSFIFDVGNATHLKGKIRNLTHSLLSYREGRMAPDQIGEDCHTVIELLLKAAVPCDGPMTFAGLVERAHEANYFNDKARNALIRLKDLRRESKHRGQSITPDEMDGLILDVVPTIHSLTKIIRNGPR
jgi:hypothetical protein